jgi:hypothetical protein
MKKAAYGVGLIGLIVSACLYLHVSCFFLIVQLTSVKAANAIQVAAKYLFVRILRDSRHLQQNTVLHWGTWL